MPLPATIPVIVLVECTLFPHALLPLYIYEQRYRSLLTHSLSHERFFCVGTLKNGILASGERDDDIDRYSCAGLVRACVGQADGTSRLILQGVRRICFVDWLQREPFRIARIEPVPNTIRDLRRATRLAREVVSAARTSRACDEAFAKQFDEHFGCLNDPEIVADVIGYNFLTRTADKQPLLGMGEVEARLEYLLEKLHSLHPMD
ncbi:MAG: LON peptidase substrate-binding domain-containing protein [Verrucomicrobiales bacterium]